MSYQPQHYGPARAASPNPNHWLDLLLKAGGLLGGVTIAAVIGAHLLRKYGPPARTAPIARIVRYYNKGAGAAGGSGHWIMEASEGSREWTRAVRYCQARASAQDAGWSGAAPKAPAGPAGCATIDTLAESGY